MTSDEIKSEIRRLTGLRDSWVGRKDRHEKSMVRAGQRIDDINEQISSVRDKCQHDFGNQKPTHTGRGICIICGQSDY